MKYLLVLEELVSNYLAMGYELHGSPVYDPVNGYFLQAVLNPFDAPLIMVTGTEASVKAHIAEYEKFNYYELSWLIPTGENIEVDGKTFPEYVLILKKNLNDTTPRGWE